MPSTRAIIVGVDGYAFQPLGSAVNDALAIRDALLGRDGRAPLLHDSDVTLLASPADGVAPAGSAPATYQAILNALKPYYDGSDYCDRMIFYFAGHGLSASRDGRTRQSLILPADTASPEDGRSMICVDELLGVFAERGPREQLWIFDACRNVEYQRRPRGYELAWNDEPPQAIRAQAAIYAVAPGGTAKSQAGGHGQFTSFILKGLAGDGVAADHIPGQGHCVTVRSLHAYARAKILKRLEGLDNWTLTVQAPQLSHSGAELQPLRPVSAPPLKEFRVRVVPAEAEAAIDVGLEVQQGLPVNGWPPSAPPRVYELRARRRATAERRWGEPRPALQAVDLRELEEATVEVPEATGGGGIEAAGTDPAGHAKVLTLARKIVDPLDLVRGGLRAGGAGGSSIKVTSADVASRVVVTALEAPFRTTEGPVGEAIPVAPGPWKVELYLGSEVTTATTLVVGRGERREVAALVQITPALAAILRPDMLTGERAPRFALLSESIGPMQAAILPTLLPLFALKPFDEDQILLRQFDELPVPLAFEPADGACGVAIALEGPDSPAPRLRFEGVRYGQLREPLLGRIGLAVVRDRAPRGILEILVEGRGRLRVAAPKLANGVTVIGASVWPDGRLDVSVGVFHLPLGTEWPDPRWPSDKVISPERIARAVALAARQIQTNGDLRALQMLELDDAAWGKWVNPILGALAFHAADQRFRANDPNYDDLGYLLGVMRENMAAAFAGLPDSRIFAAWSKDREVWIDRLTKLLDDELMDEPVLAASVALLAEAAEAVGSTDHWSLERVDQLAFGAVFNAIWTPDPGDRE